MKNRFRIGILLPMFMMIITVQTIVLAQDVNLKIADKDSILVQSVDITAPVINSITVDKTEVNIGDIVTVTLDVTEASGATIVVYYKQPVTGNLNTKVFNKNGEGKYVGTYEITDAIESGTWEIYSIYAADAYNNVARIQNQVDKDLSGGNFTVSGSTSVDITAPVINSITVDKTEVNIGDIVTVTLDVTEASGATIVVYYKQPVTGNLNTKVFNKNGEGKYVGTYEITDAIESGTWEIYSIYAADAYNNVARIQNKIDKDLSGGNFTVSGVYDPVTPPPTPEKNIDENKAIEDIGKAQEGTSISVPVKNNEPIPLTILENLKGKDVDVEFEFENYSWRINGKSINALSEDIKSYDLSVKTIDDPELGELANGEDVLQIEITHNGELPFIGQLTYSVDPTLNGKTVYRYYYDEVLKKLIYQDEAVVIDGEVTFNFEHTSKYVITDSDQLKEASIECSYQTHVQNIGWQGFKTNGDISGTMGQSLRLEGIEIRINGSENLKVEYKTHVQNIGWQDFKSNGEMSGTNGESLRLEAIQIKLTGSDADKYDIYYCVHAQNVGWMGWAKNGESAGTEGFGYRLEGIRILIVPRGTVVPGSTDLPFLRN
ncbi:hypothetical protein GH811_15980 [Acetobacterium malicum]|uniref:Ig-like domain-containing protein n=1 Tax=Acetobacterium malicum TaxID=52692 RepID=A0ABR6Z1G4_9FIRM|nr:hypothetical protein [Acetobacterium malicum]MBC3901116.1 hypothetical protein [Acetobacterium malicum]